MADRDRALHRGYTLNTLFLLMAACAVVVAMVTPLLRGQVRAGGDDLLGSAVVGGVVMILLGSFVGLFHFSRANGVGWGVIVGALLGLICGPIMLIPPQSFRFVFFTALGGSALILAVATVIRLSISARTPEPPPTSAQDVEPVQATVVQPRRHPLDPDPDEDTYFQ